MMVIEEIVPCKNGKVKVCLHHEADFLLYKKEAQKYHLTEGQELSQETYEEILREILVPRAKKRAMFLLEKMDRSQRQLTDKLKDNGYPEEVVEQAIAYVKSYHYIDDKRLAESYVRFYQESRSRRRITQDLLKKGIDKDIIEEALEQEFQQSEEDMIQALLVKKKYDKMNATRKEQEKMYRFLMQRGFKSSDISHALRQDYLT